MQFAISGRKLPSKSFSPHLSELALFAGRGAWQQGARSRRYAVGFLTAACVIMFASSAIAAPAYADLPAQLTACRAIAGNEQRLACFDELAAQPSAATAAPPVVGSAPPLILPPPPRNFGSESLPPPPVVDQPKNLKANVVGSIHGISKGLRIVLDNGQQWRSVDDHDYDCEADRPQVMIDRNFAGNYWMAVRECGYRFRVRRVK